MRFATGCVVARFMRMLDSMEEIVDVVANGARLGLDKHKKGTFGFFCNFYISGVLQVVILIHHCYILSTNIQSIIRINSNSNCNHLQQQEIFLHFLADPSLSVVCCDMEFIY